VNEETPGVSKTNTEIYTALNLHERWLLHEQLAATLKHSALFSQGIFNGFCMIFRLNVNYFPKRH